MTKYALEIEHEACWGCRTCEIACKQEFQFARGVQVIYVSEDGPRKIGDRWEYVFQVNVCRHCDPPPCAEACPQEAITRRQDGIVILDDQLCSGCRACLEACPYDVIAFDETDQVAQKCNLCHHRVDAGLMPACADNVCLAHCIHFKAQAAK